MQWVDNSPNLINLNIGSSGQLTLYLRRCFGRSTSQSIVQQRIQQFKHRIQNERKQCVAPFISIRIFYLFNQSPVSLFPSLQVLPLIYLLWKSKEEKNKERSGRFIQLIKMGTTWQSNNSWSEKQPIANSCNQSTDKSMDNFCSLTLFQF